MAIPPSCAACGMFQQPGDLCRRHAPSPATAQREVAQWPRREPTSRCGEGSHDPPIQCGSCIFWWQPGGKPLKEWVYFSRQNKFPIWNTPARTDRGPDWWQHSGLCVRHTAAPAGETQLYHPRVTHATLDGCGEGKMPEDS